MTGIRAWARRGLASDPKTDLILDGHEIAWLTLRIISEKAEGPRPSSEDIPKATSDPQIRHGEVELESLQSRQKSSNVAEITPEIGSGMGNELLWNIRCDETFRNAKEIIWEPIMGFDSLRRIAGDLLITAARKKGSEVALNRPRAADTADAVGMSREDLYMFQQLYAPLQFETPLDVDLTKKSMSVGDDALKLYQQIATIVPANNAVISAANSLASVIEKVMNILCDFKAVQWKTTGIPIALLKSDQDNSDSDYEEPDEEITEISWGFPISTRIPADEYAQTRKLYFHLERVYENPVGSVTGIGPVRWQLQDRELFVGVLSLWLYSFARKVKASEKVGEPITRIIRSRSYNFAHRRIGRIIGMGSVRGRDDIFHPLSQWLGVRISDISLPNGLNDIHTGSDELQPMITWYLGMFLSPMAR